jgi:hypothetical protein
VSERGRYGSATDRALQGTTGYKPYILITLCRNLRSVKGFTASSVTAWVTSNTQEMVSTTATLGSDGSVSGSVPGRSLVTFVLTK